MRRSWKPRDGRRSKEEKYEFDQRYFTGSVRAHKIDWVRKNCPLLRSLEEDFGRERPFEGLRIALSIHLEAKTAYLCKVLAAGGAEMYITGSNPAVYPRMMWRLPWWRTA